MLLFNGIIDQVSNNPQQATLGHQRLQNNGVEQNYPGVEGYDDLFGDYHKNIAGGLSREDCGIEVQFNAIEDFLVFAEEAK